MAHAIELQTVSGLDRSAPMQVPLTFIDGFATRSESRPRALETLRDRSLIWRACLAFCFAFWIAAAFGIYALVFVG